jgi:sulfur-carrier protein adenylyltransferase/sulfurtransferase
MAESKRGRDIVKQAKAEIEPLTLEQVDDMIRRHEPMTLVDVREGDEWRAGHLPGAIHIPRGYFELQVDEKLPDKDAPIVLYCAGGNRSAMSAKTLKELGYTDVRHMIRGFSGWRDGGFEVVQPKTWTPEQRERYSRHFVLPEVGEAGQRKISEGKVLVVGAGDLGIVDFDTVDISNLQRQVIHSTSRIGMNKAESARQAIDDLNPDVDVQIWKERLTPDNVDGILEQFDMVIDATDNFPTRYLINEAAVKQGKPYIYGSIFRFEGYASTFWSAKGGPCYRCMHAEAPPDELAPT